MSKIICKKLIVRSTVFFLMIFIFAALNRHGTLAAKAVETPNLPAVDTTVSIDGQANMAISLNSQDPDVNKRFNIVDMLPGDKCSQNYELSVKSPAPSVLKLEMVRTSAKSDFDLAEKLSVEIITEDDQKNETSVFKGSMANLIKNPVTTSLNKNSNRLVYNIAVSLPDDTGNDYQAQNFTGDLTWSIVNNTPIANPETGYKNIQLLIIAICSAISFVFICFYRKKLLLLWRV